MRIERWHEGPRLFVFGRRVHHGLFGLGLLLLGAALAIDDLHDWREWL